MESFDRFSRTYGPIIELVKNFKSHKAILDFLSVNQRLWHVYQDYKFWDKLLFEVYNVKSGNPREKYLNYLKYDGMANNNRRFHKKFTY